jgi:hypothetical protein
MATTLLQWANGGGDQFIPHVSRRWQDWAEHIATPARQICAA